MEEISTTRPEKGVVNCNQISIKPIPTEQLIMQKQKCTLNSYLERLQI